MRVKITEFLGYFAAHAVETSAKAPSTPPAHQEGYSMGAVGEVATVASLERQARDYQPNDWQSYYNRTRKWLGRRVWDCNGMAEGFYKDKTGVSINTKARHNFANWCGRKSPTTPDANLTGMPQMPGVAVFSGDTAATISHVGYLLRKVGTGPLDWLVIEAKGADYGVVITKLTASKWRWWGVMDKYFDYGEGGQTATTAQPPTPAKEDNGAYHAICGGDRVNVRSAPSTGTVSIGQLNKGDKMLAQPADKGWCPVSAEINGRLVTGYMSAEYVKKV